jgi:Zn-dependent metalloprotease
MARYGLLIAGMVACVCLAGSQAYSFIPPDDASQGTSEPARMAEDTAPSAEAQARWQAFEAVEGHGFTAVWNPVTGTPHRIQGKGIALAAVPTEATVAGMVSDFVRSHADLLGVDPEKLRLVSREKHGSRWYTDYQQVHQGIDVVGGRVHVRLTENGTVTVFGSDIYPDINISAVPALSEAGAVLLARQEVDFDDSADRVVSSRLVVLPEVTGSARAYSLAYEVVVRIQRDPAAGREPALWRLYVDANSGDLLRKTNEIRYDTVSGVVTGYIKPMYITDPDEERAFADQYLEVVGYGEPLTDQSGHYSLEAGTGGVRTVKATLAGAWAEIWNAGGYEALAVDSIAPGSQLDFTWTGLNSDAAERSAYYHAQVVHGTIKALDPGFIGMDYPTEIFVNSAGLCNAYWDGSTVTLGAGAGSCQNLALFCDVLYHEYGHGIVDMQYRPQSPSGAMHEAFSDYNACTITGESYIGEGLSGPGTYFRNLANTLRYPEDLTGEVHDDGRILAGALWDLRTSLAPDRHLADSLVHYARYGKSDNFFDYYYDVIETDDDDGNLANGTPHYFEIVDAFGKHGIGPGLYIDIAHAAIHDSEDSVASFPVVATITSNLALDPDSIRLFYSTGGAFTSAVLVPTATPGEYAAAIPGQSVGTTVSYYIYARAAGQSTYATHPDGAPSALNVFSIGTDVEAPVVSHTPLEDQPDAAWPPTVAATVTDNLGLESVALEYNLNGVAQTPIAMTRSSGTDTYQASFQGSVDAGDYVEYRIRATDASAARHVTCEPASGYNLFGIADAVVYTFEAGAEGWTHSAQSGWTDQWHVSTQRNHTAGGGQSWKCGSTGAGAYANRVSALLETPQIEIGENATLTFWYWMDAETYEPLEGSGLAWDGAALSLVDSAGKVTPIDPVDGYSHRILPDSDAPFNDYKPVYSGHSGWTLATFDLSSYHGRGKIRFKFGSDGAVGMEGLYIDDVVIWSQGALAGVGDGCGNDCIDPGLPVRFALAGALPNPTRAGVSVAYSVPAPGARVAIQVFDVRGRLASTLVDGTKPAGRHTAVWDGRDAGGTPVAPGIYFIRMEAGDFGAASKVVLMR